MAMCTLYGRRQLVLIMLTWGSLQIMVMVVFFFTSLPSMPEYGTSRCVIEKQHHS